MLSEFKRLVDVGLPNSNARAIWGIPRTGTSYQPLAIVPGGAGGLRYAGPPYRSEPNGILLLGDDLAADFDFVRLGLVPERADDLLVNLAPEGGGANALAILHPHPRVVPALEIMDPLSINFA